MNIAVMNRRTFFKSAFASATISMMPRILMVGAASSTLALTGCNGNTVIGVINTVLASAEAILAVAEPGATWVANFTNAITALRAAEKTWSSGGAVTIVIDALNTLELVAAAIPFTAVYSPLIDVLIAGIEAVLSALPVPTPTPAAKATPKALQIRTRVNGAGVRLVLHKIDSYSFVKTKVQIYKDTWNSFVDASPELAKAKLN